MGISSPELRQIDLAHLAGCTPKSVAKAMRGKLKPALTSDGTRVFRDHPLVVAYINKPHSQRLRSVAAYKKREAAYAATAAGSTNLEGAERVESMLASLVPGRVSTGEAARSPGGYSPPQPPPGNLAELLEADRAQIAKQELVGLQTQMSGALPAELDDLRAMTLGGILDQFGTFSAMETLVKSSKLFAETKIREVEASKKRAELVDRKIVSDVVMPMVETCFRRLTTEAPRALREPVVARVQAGGDGMYIDIETLIHDQLSRILKDCVDSVEVEVKKIEQ